MGRVWITLSLMLLFIASSAFGQRQTREEYILKYKGIVIDQMVRYGIPASIKMAQALLESDNGNSRLAIEANNHFGIKCRGEWKGETISHNDDAAGECFRKYGSIEESFIDHSDFLNNSLRYDALFDLEPDDYVGWAQGLKRAGYATSPTYAQMLIKIIEDNKLYLLDKGDDVTYKDIKKESVKVVVDTTMAKINVDNYNITIDRVSGRQIRYNNGVSYILVEKGDNFESIAADFKMNVSRLLKFNDLSATLALSQGDALYVKSKAKRSNNGYSNYVVETGDSMHSISQKFGVRLNSLYKINNMTNSDSIRDGQQIKLR